MRSAGKVVTAAAVVVIAVGAAVIFIGRGPAPAGAIAPEPVTYQVTETQPAPASAPAAPAAEVLPAVQAEPVEVITPEVQDQAQIAEDAAAVGMTSLADEPQDVAMSDPASSGSSHF